MYMYALSHVHPTYAPAVNRRMDEWVELSRIDVGRGPVEEEPKGVDYLEGLNGRERKVTRNLKRKHDEINHVQKVRREGVCVCVCVCVCGCEDVCVCVGVYLHRQSLSCFTHPHP